MARIICGISGVPFTCDHVPMTLAHREMNHPIFYLPQKKLLGLYSTYIKGQLTDIDSYLLFVALLNSTDSVVFTVPTQVTTSTERIIASNIKQLVSVIWETNAITHPAFKQPRFFIRSDTSTLDTIHSWILSWRQNIEDFKAGIDSRSYAKKLLDVEAKLEKLIFSPTNTTDTQLCNAVANWACLAADFPVAKMDEWKLIIRKCYNMQAMFNTSKASLIELKEYCEENLEAGSIHFHTLMKTLRIGIANHNDFLGLGSFESPTTSYGYTLLDSPEDTAVGEESMLRIIESAPLEAPQLQDYPDRLSFLKAKLAYNAAKKAGV